MIICRRFKSLTIEEHVPIPVEGFNGVLKHHRNTYLIARRHVIGVDESIDGSKKGLCMNKVPSQPSVNSTCRCREVVLINYPGVYLDLQRV